MLLGKIFLEHTDRVFLPPTKSKAKNVIRWHWSTIVDPSSPCAATAHPMFPPMHFTSALVYVWLSLFNYYKNFMKLTMLEFGIKDDLQLPSPAHSHSYLAPAYLI